MADQRNWQIIAMDYDPVQGTASNRRIFATIPKEEGQPDGLIVDRKGISGMDIRAAGNLPATIRMEKSNARSVSRFRHVISFAFGGKELDELYVTTCSWDFTDEDRKKQPWAGDLLSIQTGIKGLIEPAFAGNTSIKP